MKIKKAKGTKKYVIKRKFKFEDYKNCLKATKLEKKKNKKKIEKNKVDVGSLRENHKEFIILRSQQIFRSEKHNVFIEEVNKIAQSISDDKKKNNQSTQQKNMHMKQAIIQYDKKNKLNATI